MGKEMIIFPNPAKTGMTFRINLEAPAHIQLEIYSAAGKHIARLEQNLASSPAAELFWSCANNAPGIYFVKTILRDEQGQQNELATRKVAITK